MLELKSPITKGMASKRKSRTNMDDTRSANLLSLINLSLKSRFTNSAEIKTEIKEAINAIVTENSNPRDPISGKKVSNTEIKTIKASEIRAFFENNISIRDMKPTYLTFNNSININIIMSTHVGAHCKVFLVKSRTGIPCLFKVES